jgi:hypothetical protein
MPKQAVGHPDPVIAYSFGQTCNLADFFGRQIRANARRKSE